MKRAVILRYYTLESAEGARVTLAEALDASSQEPVAAYSLQMMEAWLKRNGFRWLQGSSGVWVPA